MSFTVPARAICAHKSTTHNNGKFVGNSLIARSNVSGVRASPMLTHKTSPLTDVYYNLCMEIETIGGAPTPPIPAILGGNDWAQDGCIKFGVAKTPLDPVYNAEYCDPILGHNNNKDFFPNELIRALNYSNTVELSAVALQRIVGAATGQPVDGSSGSAAKAAESLNYFLFAEKVIRISQEEFLGPEALGIIVTMMSYLAFSAATSKVLLAQHQSLAKKVAETFGECCAYAPHSISVDLIVDVNEARTRAPEVLALGAQQSGGVYARRQLALLQPMGEQSVSASQASRLLAVWAKLEKRFDDFIPSNQQVAFLANTVRVGITGCTSSELEHVAGAMEAFKYVPPSTTMPLIYSIVEEVVHRLAAGKVSVADAGTILAVAQHTAAEVGGSIVGGNLKNKIMALISEI